MARQGVFNREITQLEQIKRSLQMLEHRHSTTLQYGVIIPNFTEYLYPNETLRLKTTNFLRTIPLKTPQLTRVRVVQRFMAFPIRLLWEFFPEYINALNPPKEGIPEEPYIVNFNSIVSLSYNETSKKFSLVQPQSFAHLTSGGYTDLSAMSIGNRKAYTFTNAVGSIGRQLYSFGGTPASPPLSVPNNNYIHIGYQFFPHELGDYLNMPLYSASLAVDTSSRITAYKFAAYQLGYSFFYRRPNIEERIDDWYEMEQSGFKDQLLSEYPSLYAHYDHSAGKLFSPISLALSHIAAGYSRRVSAEASSPSGLNHSVNGGVLGFHPTDWSQDSDLDHIRVSSWENAEHFPLKAGPNICMQSKYVDANGRTVWQDSTISLFRLRYAPWFMDRFTSANPWPQRGDEALIPVNGSIAVTLPDSTTVTFSNLSATLPSLGVSVGSASGVYDNSVRARVTLPGTTLAVSESFTSPVSVRNEGSDTVSFPSTFPYLQTVPNTATVSGSAAASFSSSSANVAYSLSVSPSNFRFYMQLQHMKEMSGMTDGRYKSFLSMFFGSHDKDYRLDRPEFIGGFVQDLDVSEVTQTTPVSDSPLGSLAGKGVSAKRGSTIQYHAFEHALVMGFLHIVPDSEYIGGLNIQDNTTDPFDWILPQFAGLSEQPIRMKELVCRPSKIAVAVNDDNNVVFGYEPRFNQRRARHSFVTGDFRDTMNSGGNYEYFKPWLITRNFGFDVDFVLQASSGQVFLKALQFNVPSLSKEFVTMRHNVDYSNFSVTDPSLMRPFILDSYFEERLTAIIPRRGIPKI